MAAIEPPIRPRTVSIGGATYDLFVKTGLQGMDTKEGPRVLPLPMGGKIRVKQVVEACGGGASNTSVGLRRLGCDAGFCGVIGDDPWGDRLRTNFENEQVDTSMMVIVEKETTSFSLILLEQNGERSILYEPGTNQHLHDANFDRSSAHGTDWIYLNRIHEHSGVIEDDLLAIVSQSNTGLTWNPGGSHLESGVEDDRTKQLLKAVNLLLLNKEEALQFSRQTTLKQALEVIMATGVGVCIVTDSQNGAIATDGQTLYRVGTLPNTTIVDTTGAGDAFGTAATWAKILGKDLPTMLCAGTINASSVISAIGAQPGLLTDTQMIHRLQDLHLEVEEQSFAAWQG